MKSLFQELDQRNRLLFRFGLLSFTGAAICIILSFISDLTVLGINAWIKPSKFFMSIGIFSWTMAWYLHYLKTSRKVRIYNWVVIITLSIELVIITWQAANGRLSHFNTTTPFYLLLFNIMGISIVLLILFTAFIGVQFFTEKTLDLPPKYIWGIRLGIILFVIFSFQGGMMAARLSHTVGSTDGGPGLPYVNWSREHGDLRIAHFLGMHALQLIPLFSWFVANKKWHVFAMTALYFTLTLFLLLRAMAGNALI